MFQLASQRRSGTDAGTDVDIYVENDLNHALHCLWLDYDGKEMLCGTCLASQSWSQRTNSLHPWSLRNEANEEIARVCFQESGTIRASSIVAANFSSTCFRLAPQRKSAYDPKGDVTVKLVNDTDSVVNFSWIDYDGNVKEANHCSSTWSTNTNSDHPWLVQDVTTGNELACMCFIKSGEVLLSVLLASAKALVDANGDTCKLPPVLLKQQQKRARHNDVVCKPGDLNCWRDFCSAPTVTSLLLGAVYEANEFNGFTVFIEQGCFEKHPLLWAQITGDIDEI